MSDSDILEAVGAEAAAMEDLTGRLIEAPTVLGDEEPGQRLMREAFAGLGLEPIDVAMDPEALRAHPGAAPFGWDVSKKTNVVATWHPKAAPSGGAVARSLVLNGHVDVVPGGDPASWKAGGPFIAHREGDWLYGRGGTDMKGGLAAIVGAVRGLRRLGVAPLAPITLQSVVEEECTGNGTLACILAGYTADAAIVAEPFGAAITTSQVGVLWFQVRVAGVPGHAGDPAATPNAIESSLRIIEALRELERELNTAPPPPYDRIEHPINLNVGRIAGGDWPSSAPEECVTSYRIALYPSGPVRDLQDRIEAAVASAAAGARPSNGAVPPQVRYEGFACEGYEIDHDAPLVRTLTGSYERVTGETPTLLATTATTDARLFGLYANMPAVCFGPFGEKEHGIDERVSVSSIVRAAKTMALFIRDWCGLER